MPMLPCAHYLPEFDSEFPGRHVKLQDVAEASEECLVNVLDEVGGEDDDTSVSLNMVEEHPHIHVGIAICRRTKQGKVENINNREQSL